MTKQKPLTPAMEAVLAAIRKEGKAVYMPYMGRFGGDYWYVWGYPKHCTKQVHALIERGYLKRVQKDNARRDIEAHLVEGK